MGDESRTSYSFFNLLEAEYFLGMRYGEFLFVMQTLRDRLSFCDVFELVTQSHTLVTSVVRWQSSG